MLKACLLALCLAAPCLALNPPKGSSYPRPWEKCIVDGWFSRSYHPTYFVKSTGVDGETLTMNDETIWAIASNSMDIVASWAPNSPIVISPSRWYSQYEYYLTNT